MTSNKPESNDPRLSRGVRAANLRLGLILLSVVLVFFFGMIVQQLVSR
ncbi:MAG: cytochrome oxidase small assembly protein [Janthinobacterium lividum]